MSMPWYITLVLFLLSPLYTIAVRDRLWPRFQDWWATRSTYRLSKRISKLEKQLSDADVLMAHTKFESYLLQVMQGVLVLVGMGTHIVIGFVVGIATVFHDVLLAKFGTGKLIRMELVVVAAIIVNWTFVLLLVTSLRRYSNPRSQAWREITREDIEALRAKLA